jgi:hypothetical protein
MEHSGWDWGSDDDTGNPGTDAGDTHDLNGPGFEDHLQGFDQGFEDGLPGDSGHGFDDAGHSGTHDAGHDASPPGEPLGTENAVGDFDAEISHHDADPHFTDLADHDPDVHEAGHDGPGGPDGPDEPPHQPPHDPGGFDDDPDDRPGHDALVGTDPDVDHGADDPGWHDAAFPPDLGITDPPEPVDGFPWSDPDTLGSEHPGGDGTDDYSRVLDNVFDGDGDHTAALAGYDHVDVPPGTDAWTTLLGSDDPATSALARWWQPT